MCSIASFATRLPGGLRFLPARVFVFILFVSKSLADLLAYNIRHSFLLPFKTYGFMAFTATTVSSTTIKIKLTINEIIKRKHLIT